MHDAFTTTLFWVGFGVLFLLWLSALVYWPFWKSESKLPWLLGLILLPGISAVLFWVWGRKTYAYREPQAFPQYDSPDTVEDKKQLREYL